MDGRAAASLAPGDALGFFAVLATDAREAVLGLDDTHLDVRVGFLKRSVAGRASYMIASWVRAHNRFGRVYMLPVGPMHKLIVRAGMRRLRL